MAAVSNVLERWMYGVFNKELYRMNVWRPFFKDYSGSFSMGGNSIKIPKNNTTINIINRADAGTDQLNVNTTTLAGIKRSDPQLQDYLSTNFNLDQLIEIPEVVNYIEEASTIVNAMGEVARKVGIAYNEYIDDACRTVADSLATYNGGSQKVMSTDPVLDLSKLDVGATEDDFIAEAEKLNQVFAKARERMAFLHIPEPWYAVTPLQVCRIYEEWVAKSKFRFNTNRVDDAFFNARLLEWHGFRLVPDVSRGEVDYTATGSQNLATEAAKFTIVFGPLTSVLEEPAFGYAQRVNRMDTFDPHPEYLGTVISWLLEYGVGIIAGEKAMIQTFGAS